MLRFCIVLLRQALSVVPVDSPDKTCFLFLAENFRPTSRVLGSSLTWSNPLSRPEKYSALLSRLSSVSPPFPSPQSEMLVVFAEEGGC